MNLKRIDWKEVEQQLDEFGYAKTPVVLSPSDCAGLIKLYTSAKFRNVIDMERFRFGIGQYKYFADPLPAIIQNLRSGIYPNVVAIANRWQKSLGFSQVYPDTLDRYLDLCAKHAQTKPTPLLLRYEAGGYNCLHQDLYGELSFPFQATVWLTPSGEYTGGEFLLVEQRPQQQSRGEAIQGEQGEMIIFPVRHRPILGKRGYYRANVRHGVSRLRSGLRYTLGIIFHNAK